MLTMFRTCLRQLWYFYFLLYSSLMESEMLLEMLGHQGLLFVPHDLLLAQGAGLEGLHHRAPLPCFWMDIANQILGRDQREGQVNQNIYFISLSTCRVALD